MGLINCLVLLKADMVVRDDAWGPRMKMFSCADCGLFWWDQRNKREWDARTDCRVLLKESSVGTARRSDKVEASAEGGKAGIAVSRPSWDLEVLWGLTTKDQAMQVERANDGQAAPMWRWRVDRCLGPLDRDGDAAA